MGDKMGAKEKIMETVVALLSEGKDITKVTNRDIAAMAGVNSALINYYYQSKENLIDLAAGECMARIGGTLSADAGSTPPIERIRVMLKNFTEFCLHHTALAEIAVNAELKSGSLYTSRMLFPLFKEHFGEHKTDLEIKLITIQLLNPMQMMFLNRSDYKAYLSLDMDSSNAWDTLVDLLLRNLTKEG